MIVNTGKEVIKRYFGGQIGTIGTHLAIGIGSTAAALGDTALNFEVARIPVSASADLANSRVVYKASLPAGTIYKVNEVGLMQASVTLNYNVLPFTKNLRAAWTGGTLSATGARFQESTLAVTAGANGTTMAENLTMQFDLTKYDSTDTFAVAYQADANLSSLRIRVGSSAADYHEYVITPPGAGYQISRVSLGSGTVTGSPVDSSLTYIAVRPSAKASGSTTVYVDGIRVEDTAPGGGILVARSVISTPSATDLTISTDIEYALGISV